MTDAIEKTTTLKASIDKVWDAIIDHEKFGEWFLVKLYQPFRVGEITRGHITHPDAEGMEWESVTKEIRPKTYFAMIWYPDDAAPTPGQKRVEMLVEFKLREVEDGTHLTIIESGFDALPDGVRDEVWRRNEGGWTEQIRNISEYVDG